MNLNYFDTKSVEHLVEEYYEISFSKDSTPFQSTILPIALSSITNIFSDGQKAVHNGKDSLLKGLIITGQFFRSYTFIVKNPSNSFGMSLHPTALHKLLGIDVSKLSNKHLPLSEVHKDFYDKLTPLFIDYKNPKDAIESINKVLLETELITNKNTKHIDKAIDIIRGNEGMLHVDDLLKEIPFSQKTLETHFKKVIGLTPGKYIRLYRFLKLMRKYESQQIALNDLIYMYDYYDQSHFSKDFKLFMLESPKSYFKKDYPFLKKYLNK